MRTEKFYTEQSRVYKGHYFFQDDVDSLQLFEDQTQKYETAITTHSGEKGKKNQDDYCPISV